MRDEVNVVGGLVTAGLGLIGAPTAAVGGTGLLFSGASPLDISSLSSKVKFRNGRILL